LEPAHLYLPFVEIFNRGTVTFTAAPRATVAKTLDDACIVIYSECGYSGESQRICDDDESFTFEYEVKSVHVPNGKHITLFGL